MEKYTRESERLIFRVLTEDNLEDFYNILKIDDVGKWLLTGRGKTWEETLAKIHLYTDNFNELGYGPWGVFEKESGELIGQSGLMPTEDGHIGLVYSFHPDVWYQGYGSESCELALKYGFTELGVDHIVAYIRPENARSFHVVEKCGLTQTELRDFKGVLMMGFEITREDWLKKHK